MDNLILQARLFEKQMQQGGEQQDANGDGLDDKTGQPIKRVTTITEDINNKTGQVASKETKTKVINPTAEFDAQQADNRAVNGVATNLTTKSKDELINHFLLKNAYVQTWGRQSPDWYSEDVKTNERGLTTTNNDPNSVGAQGVGPLALRNNNQQSNNQNPPIMDAEFTEEEIPTNQARDSNQTPNNQTPNQPLNNQKPSMMDRMKGAAKGAAKFGAHAALGMATGGLGNLAYHKYNQSKQNAPGGTTQPPADNPDNTTQVDPNAPASYMPVGGGIKANLKNMATNYATGVMNTGKLTGQEGGLTGMWNTMTAGGAAREGMNSEQTQKDRDQYDKTNQQAVTDTRYQSNTPERAWQDPFMQVQNSYDLESKIYDLYSLQKQQSYYREIDSTEAIRFAHS